MIGTTIAHYRVLSLLGRGGMGEVYLAENLRLQKKVALKFLSPELSRDGLSLERLRREARAAAELDHPNIARIHDMQEGDGRHFLVMEYVEGETLSERLAAGGKLEPGEAERIVAAIAAGLDHAHGRGVVHRDIKSANVMLTADGGVKILDFGLAQRPDATTLTQQGAVLGTLAYMSPEQVRGAPVDARTDLWSLGVVLYECLTGRRPFDGPSAEATIHNILKTAPHSITRVHGSVSPALDGIVGRLLEKDPTRRYRAAREVLRDLGESPSSQRTVAWLPRAPFPRRRWLVPAAVVLAVVLIPLAIRWRGIVSRPESGVPRLAVLVFNDLGAPMDSLAAEGLTALLQVGLADVEGCYMVAPEHLRDVQRRRLGSGRGAVPVDRAIELVREAGATHMLSGEMVARGGLTQAVWRITDVGKKRVVATGKEEAANALDLADMVTSAAVAGLGNLTKARDRTPVGSVAEKVTSDPEAYRHFIAGTVALDRLQEQDARREFLQAVDLDSTFAMAWLELSKVYNLNTERDQSVDAAERAWRYRFQLTERERLLLDAWRLHQNNKVGSALAVYDKVLARWPDSKEAHRAKAQHLFFFIDPVGAGRAAAVGLRFYPEDTQLLFTMANVVLVAGDPDELLNVARKGMALQPELADWSSLVAHAYLLKAEPDSAEANWRRCMRLEPQEDWSMKLACVSYARGDLDGAIERLAFYGFLADAGRIEEMRTAVTDTLWSAMDTLWCAGALEYAGLWESVASLLEGWPPGPKDRAWGFGRALARVTEAHAFVHLGRLELAEETYRRFVEFLDENPEHPRGFIHVKLAFSALLALASGEPDSALIPAEQCAREWSVPLLADETVGFWEGMSRLQLKARAQAESGDLAGAIETLEKMLRVSACRTLGHFQLAEYYARAGRKEDARREYRKCLDLWRNADAEYPYPAQARERLAALDGRTKAPPPETH